MSEKIEYIVASDVNTRDGIGIEVWVDGELALELFRDNTKKTKTLTAFVEGISIETVEAALEAFKKKIPGEYLSSSGDSEI